VKGKATVDGKPAIGATVMLSAGENRMTQAPVHDDGTYEASDVPVGPVKIFIRPGPARTGMANIAQSSGPPARIPARYTKLDTSGLSLDVKGGSNDFNIEMTSK
jgi:hypothetical protein